MDNQDDDIKDVEQSYVESLEASRLSKLKKFNVDENEVIDQARKDIGNWDGYFELNNQLAKSDIQFAVRDQWTSQERSQYARLLKPALVFNKLHDIVKKVVAEERRDKRDLLVRATTANIDQSQVDLRADILRTICYSSQNELVYQQAYKNALLCGYGAYEIYIDYETKSFNKMIGYSSVLDPLQTSFDPNARLPHKGDGDFCALKYMYDKSEFHAAYPHIQNPVSFSAMNTLDGTQLNTKDTIVICKYTKKVWFPTTIYKLSDGRTVTKKEWRKIRKSFESRREIASNSIVYKDVIEGTIPEIVASMKTKDYKIMQYLLLQNCVIDVYEWPSKYLPLIFVDGDSTYIQGQQYTKSFIHDAIDPQKFLNYLASEIASDFKNRRRETWLATKANIANERQMWTNPEVQQGALIAEPDSKTGQMPQRFAPTEISQSLLAHFQRATKDIQEILGVNQDNLGQDSSAISGVAIRSRQLAGNLSSYVYRDNLDQAIEQGGRVVLDLLPFIYDEENRNIVITKQDGSSRNVVINQQDDDGNIINKITEGNYDVYIDTGPSYVMQKENAVNTLMQLASSNPSVFPLIADLVAQNIDVQNMPQLVERLKTMVPPDVLAKEQGYPPPPPQPNPQQQMMQMQMQKTQNDMQLSNERLQLEKQKLELDRMKLMLDEKEMMMKGSENEMDHKAEIHKAALNYDADMAKLKADIAKMHFSY